MSPRKVDKKKLLKEPDEFISTTMKAMLWLKRNSRLVASACLIVVVAAVAIWGWGVYQNRREAQAQELFSQAYKIYSRALEASEESTSRDLMNQAAERFSGTVKEFPGTRAAWMARLYRGRADYSLGRYDEAIKEFRGAVDSVPKGDDGTLKGLSLQGLAQAYVAKGECDKAVELLRELRGQAGGAFGTMADWELGKCYEVQGKIQEAISLYQALSAVVGQPLQREMIQARLNALKKGGGQ